MADYHDLMEAIGKSENNLLSAAQSNDPQDALVYSVMALVESVNALGIRVEIAIREAAGRG